MKKNVLTLLVVIAMVFSLTIPALATTVESWDFTMNFTYVSGKDNGEFHYMNTGTLTWDGEISLINKDTGANATPTDVRISLYEDKLGVDPVIKTVTLNLNGTKSFTKQIQQTGGKYYIIAQKVIDDGWNTSGSGDLTTP